MGEIKFGKQITVQIRSARAKSPAVFYLGRKNIFYFFKTREKMIAAAAFFPQQNMLAAAIERSRLGVVHDLNAGSRGVKNVAAILKIISDDEVRMAVTIYIGKQTGIGIPSLFSRNEFDGESLPQLESSYVREFLMRG